VKERRNTQGERDKVRGNAMTGLSQNATQNIVLAELFTCLPWNLPPGHICAVLLLRDTTRLMDPYFREGTFLLLLMVPVHEENAPSSRRRSTVSTQLPSSNSGRVRLC